MICAGKVHNPFPLWGSNGNVCAPHVFAAKSLLRVICKSLWAGHLPGRLGREGWCRCPSPKPVSEGAFSTVILRTKKSEFSLSLPWFPCTLQTQTRKSLQPGKCHPWLWKRWTWVLLFGEFLTCHLWIMRLNLEQLQGYPSNVGSWQCKSRWP